MSLSLNQFFMLYMWFPLTALLVFLMLIARFFERFSGHRTYYHMIPVSVVFFGIGAVRYASITQIAGDMIGDVMMGVGGLLLMGISLKLFWLMIVSR